MNVGEYVDFNYTGAMQSFPIPNAGVYKLEVWGGKGESGGNGGYSIGYIKIKRGNTIYICVGGAGSGKDGAGYNGGNTGGAAGDRGAGTGCASGGATHMALVSGTLQSIGKTSFIDNGNGLIVAGGGGGGARYGSAGSGGGINGGQSFNIGGGGSSIATQTGGYAFGRGQHGRDGSASAYTYGSDGNGAGGGGLYGGYSLDGRDYSTGGGSGGSGYIGGVPQFTYKDITYTPSTSNGVNGGNGKAKITLMAKMSNKKYGELDVVCYYGDEEIERHFGTLDI